MKKWFKENYRLEQWCKEKACCGKTTQQPEQFDDKKKMVNKKSANKKKILTWLSGWFDEPEESLCFDVNFFGFNSLYRWIFLFSSFLGLIVSGYFYCICLLYIFINIDVIRHVVKAVSGKGIKMLYKSPHLTSIYFLYLVEQLIFIGLLTLAILFIYAVFSFAFMRNFFDTADSNLFCQTLWQCYVTVIREGLLNSFGGVSSLNSCFLYSKLFL